MTLTTDAQGRSEAQDESERGPITCFSLAPGRVREPFDKRKIKPRNTLQLFLKFLLKPERHHSTERLDVPSGLLAGPSRHPFFELGAGKLTREGDSLGECVKRGFSVVHEPRRVQVEHRFQFVLKLRIP